MRTIILFFLAIGSYSACASTVKSCLLSAEVLEETATQKNKDNIPFLELNIKVLKSKTHRNSYMDCRELIGQDLSFTLMDKNGINEDESVPDVRLKKKQRIKVSYYYVDGLGVNAQGEAGVVSGTTYTLVKPRK